MQVPFVAWTWLFTGTLVHNIMWRIPRKKATFATSSIPWEWPSDVLRRKRAERCDR